MSHSFTRTIILYLFSGGTAATAQLAVYTLLSRIFDWHYLLASSTAFVCALLISFTLQKFLTFNDNRRGVAVRQFFAFTSVAILNLGINGLMMYGLVEYAQMHDIVAQILTMGTIAVWSFVIYRTLIFTPSR